MTDIQECTRIEDLIEEIIDAHGLLSLMCAAETVCHAKAEHLNHAWQDARSAAGWTAAAKVFDKAYQSLCKI